MNDYKSVQDLIVKAAMYDRVSTTISPDQISGGRDVLRITFSKGDQYSTVYLDMYPRINDHEEMELWSCKSALHKLLWGPYGEIVYIKENHNA